MSGPPNKTIFFFFLRRSENQTWEKVPDKHVHVLCTYLGLGEIFVLSKNVESSLGMKLDRLTFQYFNKFVGFNQSTSTEERAMVKNPTRKININH